MVEDTFKAIRGYEGLYAVSSDGRIKSLSRTKLCGGRVLKVQEKLLSLHRTTSGYVMVHLCRENKRRMIEVHRLVAMAWLGLPDGVRTTVNHINGVKTDNRADNLEWVTTAENISHAVATGLRNSSGEANPKAKLTAESVRLMRDLADAGVSTSDLQKLFSVGRGAVYRAVNRITWQDVA